MAPNQTLMIEFVFRNNGNTTWSDPDYRLSVLSDPCGLLGVPSIPLVPGVQIPPSANCGFLTTISVPAVETTCTLELQMEHVGDALFGGTLSQTIYVKIPSNAARNWSLYE